MRRGSDSGQRYFAQAVGTEVDLFLRAKGYTVLNTIEIRKPYKGERLTTSIPVGDAVFDY